MRPIRYGSPPEEHRTEWIAWRNMWQRCVIQTHQAYARYGGRGITVAEEWASFETFLAAVGHRPSLDHSLDRKCVFRPS